MKLVKRFDSNKTPGTLNIFVGTPWVLLLSAAFIGMATTEEKVYYR